MNVSAPMVSFVGNSHCWPGRPYPPQYRRAEQESGHHDRDDLHLGETAKHRPQQAIGQQYDGDLEEEVGGDRQQRWHRGSFSSFRPAEHGETGQQTDDAPCGEHQEGAPVLPAACRFEHDHLRRQQHRPESLSHPLDREDRTDDQHPRRQHHQGHVGARQELQADCRAVGDDRGRKRVAGQVADEDAQQRTADDAQDEHPRQREPSEDVGRKLEAEDQHAHHQQDHGLGEARDGDQHDLADEVRRRGGRRSAQSPQGSRLAVGGDADAEVDEGRRQDSVGEHARCDDGACAGVGAGQRRREDRAQQKADHRGHREGQRHLLGTSVEHLQFGDDAGEPDAHRRRERRRRVRDPVARRGCVLRGLDRHHARPINWR